MTVTLIIILIVLLLISLNTSTNKDSRPIKTILRGSSRYALASLQDKSPMIALLHANYGAGYFWAMRDAYKTTDIENIVDVLEYEKRITEIQDQATKDVMKVCPQFSKNLDLRLAKIANEI